MQKALNSRLLLVTKSILKTETFKQSGITFAGTVVNGGLGAVFYIIAARILGPSNFGLMSVALSVAMLASSVGDFGNDAGIVRFVSHYLKKDTQKAYRFLKLTLKIKAVSGITISVLGIFLSPLISNIFFQKPELAPGLKIAFISVSVALLYGFVISTLKAFQKFFLWSIVQVGGNLFRVGLILALLVFGLVSVENAMWTYAGTLLVSFIIGLLFLKPKKILSTKKENSIFWELVGYNKWIASFTLVAAVSSRLDTFISARLLTSNELGYYAAANQLVYIVPQIVGALGTVFAPKMAEMTEDKVIPYLKKTQFLVLGLSALGVMSIPVVAFMVPFVYGIEYLPAIPVFVVLLFAMLVFLISVPVHNIILYFYSYPKLFLWLSVGHLILMSVGGWILISNFGMIGAAFTVLMGTIFNFVIPAVWVVSRIKNSKLPIGK